MALKHHLRCDCAGQVCQNHASFGMYFVAKIFYLACNHFFPNSSRLGPTWRAKRLAESVNYLCLTAHNDY